MDAAPEIRRRDIDIIRLVLGDPAQLPPVAGGGYFTDASPDVMLTEVHRQAEGDPIVRLSMIVREGGRLDYGVYGESAVISRDEIDPEERALMQRALDENAVIVAQMTPFDD